MSIPCPVGVALGRRVTRPAVSSLRQVTARRLLALPQRSTDGRENSGLELLSQPLPQQRFQVLLTLSPEFFASFPHGTCALSDYPPIFSFRWSLPPILVLCSQTVRLSELGPIRSADSTTGLSPSMALFSNRLSRVRLPGPVHKTTIRTTRRPPDLGLSFSLFTRSY